MIIVLLIIIVTVLKVIMILIRMQMAIKHIVIMIHNSNDNNSSNHITLWYTATERTRKIHHAMEWENSLNFDWAMASIANSQIATGYPAVIKDGNGKCTIYSAFSIGTTISMGFHSLPRLIQATLW